MAALTTARGALSPPEPESTAASSSAAPKRRTRRSAQAEQPVELPESAAPAAEAPEAPSERVTRANAHEYARRHWPEVERLQIERLISVMRQVMAKQKLSERALARALGVTLGTTHKYFTYQVHPSRVSTGTMAKLAALAGVTIDSMLRFFDTGLLESAVSWEEVETWLRSSASSEHLGRMFEALSAAASSGRLAPQAEAPPERLTYEWPIVALQRVPALSDNHRKMLGLTDEALRALAIDGVYDDALVESFALVTGIEIEQVRQAFAARQRVEGY